MFYLGYFSIESFEPRKLVTHFSTCLNAKSAQNNEKFGEELEADLLAEGEKLGPVEKITAFAKNNKGPVVIKVGFVARSLGCSVGDGENGVLVFGAALRYSQNIRVNDV